MRSRRHGYRKPDLTSLFDVLFIIIFAALIRAAAVENAAAKAQAPAPPPKPRPVAPVTPPAVAQLQKAALADVNAQLAAKTPLVIRVSAKGVVTALEAGAKRIALDMPLLEHSPDPDVALAYLGDRSAELRLCRIAAVHLGAADLAAYLVIIAPAAPLADLPHALHTGLHRDLGRCSSDQKTIASLVDPSELPRSGP